MMKRQPTRRQAIKASRRACTTLAFSPALRRSFTLTELLAAMAIIVVIAAVTVVSVSNIAREARLSSAVNTVVAALDTGRAMAIREETLVAVVFRARLISDNKQQIEIVTARWTGESPTVNVISSEPYVIDRFEPIPGIAARRLPSGVSIAAPLVDFHGFSIAIGDYWDRIWGYASYLPDVATIDTISDQGDPPGRVFAVIYSPNGSVVMRNAQSNALRMFVDFNNDSIQQVSGCDGGDCVNGELEYAPMPSVPGFPTFNLRMLEQMKPNDEPYLSPIPYLAVYNEDDFRDRYEPLDWQPAEPDNWALKHRDLTEFVNENAERIHFNRYTGVALR